MDASTLPKHLSFLNDAAHLLRPSAPATSAHLMSHHNELMILHDVEHSDTQRQHVCGACGHIMIPGQGTTLKMETEKALRRKKRRIQAKDVKGKEDAQGRAGMRKLFTCGNCCKVTKISFPPPPQVVRRQPKAERIPPKSNQALATAAEPAKPSAANSSSKKRAKNRKAGLQALLSQAKTSSSAGRSLSLADFTR